VADRLARLDVAVFIDVLADLSEVVGPEHPGSDRRHLDERVRPEGPLEVVGLAIASPACRQRSSSVVSVLVLQDAYDRCIMICMRTTLDLDPELVSQALQETGARTKTEVIEMGLRALLEQAARRRLRALYGKGPRLEPVRRRRR
jgi:Arc/MetJ family transcription regulator